MAEAIFSRMAGERGIAHLFNVRSFATSSYERGNPVYPPAANTLAAHGMVGFSHRSQPLGVADIASSDYVLVMDGINYADVSHMAGQRYSGRVFRLGGFLAPPEDISDPYYTRDFEKAYSQISRSCAAFIEYLYGEGVLARSQG